MRKYNACDLSRILKINYGRDFNVPYLIMQDKRKIERTIEPLYEGQQELIDDWKAGKIPINYEETFQALLNGLCLDKHQQRGQFKQGDYLFCFED